MRSRVELFEQIRRDHDRERLSQRELARGHGVHRRTVRQALSSAVPPERKRPVGRLAPKLGEYRELIDSWLIADRDAPRKQRHTARRVWERVRDERGVEVSERQVRRYVRERRRALGEAVDEVFVPLCHEPGVEAEVDWGRASVLIAGVMTDVFLFLIRACFSGACFVAAYPRETQAARRLRAAPRHRTTRGPARPSVRHPSWQAIPEARRGPLRGDRTASRQDRTAPSRPNPSR
jgi:transposase